MEHCYSDPVEKTVKFNVLTMENYQDNIQGFKPLELVLDRTSIYFGNNRRDKMSWYVLEKEWPLTDKLRYAKCTSKGGLDVCIFFTDDDRYGDFRESQLPKSIRPIHRTEGYSVQEGSRMFLQFLCFPKKWTPSNHSETMPEFKDNAYAIILAWRATLTRDEKCILQKLPREMVYKIIGELYKIYTV
jgi:hypothetical protein